MASPFNRHSVADTLMRIERAAPAARHFVVLLIIWLATLLVYYPGLSGPFVFDDQYNIALNPAMAVVKLDAASLADAAVANESGPLKRPLPSLTFALNHYFAGGFDNTFAFKITNLLVHLINAALIYWLSLLLLTRLTRTSTRFLPVLTPWLPALIAAAWALHPLQLTSVLYVVQRMTSLAALFVLGGLIAYVYGRTRVAEARPHGYVLMTTGLVAGLLLGMASKENAVLLLLFISVIEFVFFYGRDRQSFSRGIRIWYAGAILLPVVAGLGWLLLHPDYVLSAYSTRSFSLIERLLTEPRVLWFYIALIVFPRGSAFGLYHDDILISTGLLSPWTTLPALLGWVFLVALAIAYVRRWPVLSFATLWFIAGHSMESSVLALEIAHEHRNYLPSFGIILGAMYGVTLGMERLQRARLILPLFFVYISVSAFVTYVRADTWATTENIIETTAKNHPSSARAQYMLAEIYAQKRRDPLKALRHYKNAADLERSDIAALIKIAIAAAETTVSLGTDSQELIEAQSKNGVDSRPQIRILGLPEFASVAHLGQRLTLVLDESLYAEIEHRLINKPVSAMTGHALGILTYCITRGERACAHLYDRTVEWYKLAISNRYADSVAKGHLAHGLAKLYLENGKLESARKMAVESQGYDPTNPGHPLLEARVHLALGNTGEAEAIIERTQARYAPLPLDLRRELETLLSQIRIQQSKK
jgi:Tfp pilus assembly protein PilF